MARVGVGDKYNLAINGVGYLVRGLNYKKKDARIFAPRFGTGEVSESDLDIYKVISQDDFSGGSFQEKFDDPSKYAGVADALPNPFDNLLHPTPQSASKALPAGTIDGTPAWCLYGGVLYKSTNYYNSGFKGAISKYDVATAAWVNVKSDFGYAVTDMAVINGFLFVALAPGNPYFRFDGTTWTSVATYGPTLLCPFNNKMFASSGAGLWYHNGNLVTEPATMIQYVGASDLYISSLVVFNHRLYIGKPDGLFAYDGVQVSCIFDTSRAVNSYNFKFLSELNGYLYWISRNVLYRFNGSTIEKIKDMTNLQPIRYMTSGYGRLWITTWGGSSYLTAGGKDTLIPANGYLLYCYDGQGLFLYDDTKYGTNSPYCVAINGNSLFYFVSGASAVVDSISYLIDLSAEFKAGTMNDIVLTSSHFDCDLPNINKYFDSLELEYENIIVDDTITIKFRTYDGKAFTAWQTLGTITSASTTNRLSILDTAYSGVYKKIQFEITIDRAVTSNLALRGYSFRYILSPEYKRDWQISLLCVGIADNPLELLDSSEETKFAPKLRENLYLVRCADEPVGFEDIDYSLLNGNHTNAVTTITVDTTDLFPEYGYIKIDDEIIKYTGKTATSFTGCTRARFSTSAASHTDNAIINLYYRVVMSDIINEEVYFPVDPLDTSAPVLNNPETVMTVILKEA